MHHAFGRHSFGRDRARRCNPDVARANEYFAESDGGDDPEYDPVVGIVLSGLLNVIDGRLFLDVL